VVFKRAKSRARIRPFSYKNTSVLIIIITIILRESVMFCLLLSSLLLPLEFKMEIKPKPSFFFVLLKIFFSFKKIISHDFSVYSRHCCVPSFSFSFFILSVLWVRGEAVNFFFIRTKLRGIQQHLPGDHT
jgi:hypothetical protein